MTPTRSRLLPMLPMILLLLAAACGDGTAPDAGGPNILLVLIDTLRADHLGCYGYHRDTTPVIDSLAVEGTRYADVHGSCSWTLPAMATILTGLSPREHGAGRRDETFFGINPGIDTLARMLHRGGYETAAFFNVIFMNEDFGFHNGFDHFDCEGFANRASLRRAGPTVDAAIEWLEERNDGMPFFVAIHFYDPHLDYDPPEPFDTLFADPGYTGEYDSKWGGVSQLMAINEGEATIPAEGLQNLIDLYDGEIAYTDRELGRLLRYLLDEGLADSTLVFVVADHGEEFLEHGSIEHGLNLYQQTVGVPLVVSGPGVARGVVEPRTVSHLDVTPTALSAAGIEPPEALRGCDLLHGVPEGRALPASGILWRPGDLVAVRMDRLKVIWEPATGVVETYDLGVDPMESSGMAADSGMLAEAHYYWATPVLFTAPEVPFEETATRVLRDLGYIR